MRGLDADKVEAPSWDVVEHPAGAVRMRVQAPVAIARRQPRVNNV
jgi:hypothetical protein